MGVRPVRRSLSGSLAAGLVLVLSVALVPACTHFRAGTAASVRSPLGPELGPGASEALGPVERALALAGAGQPRDAVGVLEAALQTGAAPEEEALYWLGILRLALPVPDRAGGREALERLARRFPDGARGQAASGLLTLLDELDRLTADNAALREDLKKLLDIDVEAQRKRRTPGTTAP